MKFSDTDLIETKTAITKESISLSEKYANHFKLLRVTVWCLRATKAWLKKCNHNSFQELPEFDPQESNFITLKEMRYAETFWVRVVQQQEFKEEFALLKASNNNEVPPNSKLKALKPFYCEEQRLLLVGGRIDATPHMQYLQKHPAILPSKSNFVATLISSTHIAMGHAGPEYLMHFLRRRIWILRARQTIQSVLKKCNICKRLHAPPGCFRESPFMIVIHWWLYLPATIGLVTVFSRSFCIQNSVIHF